jgi:NAD(P)-dependent dehydrogenase (short-subunit alcohol dehydrogenase family)
MAGKTVLVTGASSGIGRATALGLAAMGARLAITGRDRERTESAAAEIRAVGGGQVEVFVADLSAQSEVRRLAGEMSQRLSRIDVLINNVGGYWNTRHVTADGLELTFALNHLAPFLLTNLLLDSMRQSGPARVVTVSSHAHARGRIDFGDLQGERSYSGARAYSQSKLANILFTYALARRLQESRVTAHARRTDHLRVIVGGNHAQQGKGGQQLGGHDPAPGADLQSRPGRLLIPQHPRQQRPTGEQPVRRAGDHRSSHRRHLGHASYSRRSGMGWFVRWAPACICPWIPSSCE